MRLAPLARLAAALLIALILCACGGGSDSPNAETFRIISGSENRSLEPIIQAFAKKEKVPVELSYRGSVDIMLELNQGSASTYDAVWPANSLWITLGDRDNVVKRQESILRTPVVFGVKRSVAERLGWVGRDVKVADILAAAESGRLRFMSTNATQSNSGASAYIGYLYAFAGNPEVLTSAHLQDPAVRDKIKRILGTVNRTAGSSGFLKDLFLEKYDAFDAMVNYEAIVIETNQELERTRREPLYAVYPVDGLALADSPLGYVNKGNAAKEAFFEKLLRHLQGDEAQKAILAAGRRTGPLGVNPAGADPRVFRPEWGIDLNRVITPIRFPAGPVIQEALVLYQTAFRKPSFTIFCLDFSGSMQGKAEEDLKSAMRLLLDQGQASRYLLQASPEDVTVVIPFSDRLFPEWQVRGNAEADLGWLLADIYQLRPNGGTNIYLPVQRGVDILRGRQYEDYAAAIILMTDGKSNAGNFAELKAHFERQNIHDIPVYAILFGDASEQQLREITTYTTGQIFDGRKDLAAAFREAKGYN